MNKCKDCCYCIRFASINQRRGLITAIHQDHFCMKRKRHIKYLEYECGIECKKYKEKATINEEIKCDVNPTFNCTTCKYKKECMPKENLER